MPTYGYVTGFVVYTHGYNFWDLSIVANWAVIREILLSIRVGVFQNLDISALPSVFDPVRVMVANARDVPMKGDWQIVLVPKLNTYELC